MVYALPTVHLTWTKASDNQFRHELVVEPTLLRRLDGEVHCETCSLPLSIANAATFLAHSDAQQLMLDNDDIIQRSYL